MALPQIIGSVASGMKSVFDFLTLKKEKQLETFTLENCKKKQKAIEAAEQYILMNEDMEKQHDSKSAIEMRKLREGFRKEFFKFNN